jgi:ATP-dependent Clp protease, protease subunit
MKMEKENPNNLVEKGIIFLWGQVTDSMAENVCRQIIETNIAGKVGSIQMLINSGGGSCQAGFSIIDMMEWSRIPIYTAGFGIVGSMASLIFIAGDNGKRVVTPSTALLVHHFHSMQIGNYPNLISLRKYEDFLYNRVMSHYLKYSNLKSESEVLTHLLRDVDTWLTPEEAKTLGLVDIIQNKLHEGRE